MVLTPCSKNLHVCSILSRCLDLSCHECINLKCKDKQSVFVGPCHNGMARPPVADGGTWSLILREEHRLRVFENRVLRRIFGPRRDGVTGEWRRLHNEELNDLYSSPNIVRVVKSRRLRWAGHVERMEEGRGVHKVLVGKPDGKRPLGRARRR